MIKTYATLGPACCTADTLSAMLRLGLTGFRLNLSHRTLADCRRWTAALRAAIGELFEKGHTQVVCGAFEHNLASMRVMEKAGMTRLEKTDEIEYRGKVHRCIYYGITK